MPPAAGFPDLVSEAERAVFHGPPAAALPLLADARARASGAELPPVRWLTGVALGALGRYAEALNELAPLREPAAGTEEVLYAGYAAGTVASVFRQLGDHGGGQAWDRRGLDVLAWPGLAIGEAVAEAVAEAGADCAIGLAADAVGVGNADAATDCLAEAARHVELCPPHLWRVRVRLGWVAAEVALLTRRPADAVAASRRAVVGAERARAPRHVAKSLLFLGVAQLEVGDPASVPVAVGVLRRSAVLAEELGLLPLVWPARAVLGAALASSPPGSAGALEARGSLESARVAVRTIAAGLPDGLRDAWLTRPDVDALLAS